MKICCSCKEQKPLELFHKQKKGVNGRQARCKTCMAERYRQIRANDLERYKAVSAAYKEAKRAQYLEWKAQQRCVVCGEDEPAVLDLHHLDPTSKEFSLGSSILNRKWEVIQSEIQKCAVLCANCHRKVHAGLLTLLCPELDTV